MKRDCLLSWPLLLVVACHAGGDAGEPALHASGGAGGSTPGPLTLDCTRPELGKPVLRLLNRAQLTRTIDDIFPELNHAWHDTLPADPVSAMGFDNDGATVVGPQLAQALLDTASSVASTLVTTALQSILPCSVTAPDRACADQFLTRYGRRLLRRAVSEAERARYLSFFDAALAQSDFKTALKWLTVGLIQSPNAVYRSEIGRPDGGARKLDAREVASELAYTFAGTTPSDALLAQAESTTPLDASAWANALLATDSGKLALQHFFESYLDYARVASIERANVPQFANVRADMIQETRSFIDQVVIQNRGGLKELLTADTTNPSSALAAYYGFPSPASDHAAVTRAAGRGIGVLAQGSVLASRAQPNGSSPTKRGLWVFSRLLCNSVPSPPANVPSIPTPAPGVVTTRQRYEDQHAKHQPCSTCHTLFDPIGFGFEHFDEGGRYRETENGLTIDTRSNVPGTDRQPLFQFQDQESLARGLAEQDVVYGCFAAYLATYAFGTADSCLGASRISELRAGTLGIADYYAALAAEPHFTRRASQ